VGGSEHSRGCVVEAASFVREAFGVGDWVETEEEDDIEGSLGLLVDMGEVGKRRHCSQHSLLVEWFKRRNPNHAFDLLQRQRDSTFSSLNAMSSKRKWDQAGPDGSPPPKEKGEGDKNATDAAAAAAAIAAKIAAQFAGGGLSGAMKDPHDAEYTHDIDINDVRNRYLLTKSSTQQEVHIYTFILTLVSNVKPILFRFTMKREHP